MMVGNDGLSTHTPACTWSCVVATVAIVSVTHGLARWLGRFARELPVRLRTSISAKQCYGN